MRSELGTPIESNRTQAWQAMRARAIREQEKRVQGKGRSEEVEQQGRWGKRRRWGSRNNDHGRADLRARKNLCTPSRQQSRICCMSRRPSVAVAASKPSNLAAALDCAREKTPHMMRVVWAPIGAAGGGGNSRSRRVVSGRWPWERSQEDVCGSEERVVTSARRCCMRKTTPSTPGQSTR